MVKANILWIKKSKLPWSHVFIEIALRAITNLHHRYNLYSYNQQIGEQPDFSKLNSGLGIAYADEISVCAAIAQEFMSSRFTSGVRIQDVPEINVKAGERCWRIELCPRYSDKTGELDRADFYVERIDTGGKDTIPAMIEAKRAYLYSQSGVRSQISEIKSDIEKLRSNCGDRLRGYVLIWNIATSNEQGPYGYLEGLADVGKPDIVMREVRQIPLYISNSFKFMNRVKIKRWLWVTLGEVTKLHEGDPKPDGYSDC